MKRFLSLLLALVMLLALAAVPAFADESGSTRLLMHMDNNGKVVTNSDGTRAGAAVHDKCFRQLYSLMHEVPINWDLFDYAELEMEMDEARHVTVTKQTMYANDGRKLVNSNPGVVILESPTKMHATGAGSAEIQIYAPDDTLLTSSTVTVTGRSFSNYVLKNLCGECGKEQGNGFHLMSCGHFSCTSGTVGHGPSSCGYAGHMLCDGNDHGMCTNCRKPLCMGEHGVGVCPHVHTPQFNGWYKEPTCKKSGIAYIRCVTCDAAYWAEIQPNPHKYNAQGVCTECGAKNPAVTPAASPAPTTPPTTQPSPSTAP